MDAYSNHFIKDRARNRPEAKPLLTAARIKSWMVRIAVALVLGIPATYFGMQFALGPIVSVNTVIRGEFVQTVVATLGQMGIDVLDQRRFLGDWIGRSGCWSSRAPTDTEWADVQRGLRVARLVADAGVGQAVVVKLGAVTAVEATEGTTETIRRGLAQAGPGAVVVKAAAREHDYRFDTPGVGPETIEAAASGGARVLAVEAERVLVLDRDECLRIANQAGMALVGVE